MSWRGFQLARVQFDRDGEGNREALGMANCSINIWDGSELELAWSKKSSLFFENNFSIFLLSGVSNASTFKVRDILHWVNFLVMKTFSNFFCCFFCRSRYIWIYFICHLLFIIANKFFLHYEFLHYYHH